MGLYQVHCVYGYARAVSLVFVVLITVGVDVFVILLPAFGTLFLLFCCLIQPPIGLPCPGSI